MNTHRNNNESAPQIKRNLQPYSCSPLETCRRDGLLIGALVKITEAFPSVPEPKSSWYEMRQGDFNPIKHLMRMTRGAILAAHASGDKQLLAITLENARAFCRELEADFVSLVPQESEESILACALAETAVQGPADEATMALANQPNCPTAAARAVQPLERHYSRIAKLLERCRLAARSPRTSSMVLSR